MLEFLITPLNSEPLLFLTEETNSERIRAKIFSNDNILNFKCILANYTWVNVYSFSHRDIFAEFLRSTGLDMSL